MKWVIFSIALVGVLPVAQWLRRHPTQASKVWILFGLLLYTFNPHFSPIEWPGWPGYVFGLQFTGLDLLALAFFANLPRAQSPIPFRFVMALYFFAALLSTFTAEVPMAAAFYVWQIARVFFVYVVVVRSCSDERVPLNILTGMAIGLCYQAILAIWERFGHGAIQAGGSFGHQNLLGLASEFAIFPLFALLMAGKRGWQIVAGPIAGIIIAVLTTSRASLGLAIVGVLLVFALSSLRKWTSRKASILFAGMILIALLTPIVIYSFEARFAAAPLPTGPDERTSFETAASLILADHPFGVGANNFTVAANTGGYFDRAKVPWGGDQRMSIVHNAYWLAAAETGYLGAFAFALLLLLITTATLRGSWRYKKDLRGDLLLGLGVSLLMISLHNKYEWVFFLYQVQYMFAATAGMAAGLMVQIRYPERSLNLNSRLFSDGLRSEKKD